MKILIQFYADATPEQNPFGLSAGYPWRCTEVPDDYQGDVHAGFQLLTHLEYATIANSKRPEYEEKFNSWLAAQEPPPLQE